MANEDLGTMRRAAGWSPTDEQKEMSEEYGWALAVLRSSGELWRLFLRAVDKEWTADKFVVELRKTKWFQTHSATWRENEIQRLSDPGTWSDRMNERVAELQDMAVQLGGQEIGAKTAQSLAYRSLMFGWNEAQTRNILAGYLKQAKGGGYGGEAGAAEQELRAYANDMGVTLSDATVGNWLKKILAQKATVEGYKSWIQRQAMSAYGGLSAQIKAGQTVRELADPYMQLMGDVWEENPAAIGLKNPTILKALGGIGADGKPTMMSLGDFRRMLKQDPRYLKTKAAVDDATDIGHQILRDFGLVG